MFLADQTEGNISFMHKNIGRLRICAAAAIPLGHPPPKAISKGKGKMTTPDISNDDMLSNIDQYA